MNCAWQAYINLLPVWLRQEVDKQGRDHLQELRLRLDKPPEMVLSFGSVYLERIVSIDDLRFCVNLASRYSPWSAATMAQGYITGQGGHRMGLCGEAVVSSGKMSGINSLSSICLRVARDFPGIAAKAVGLTGSVLIIGKPGSGKTTLLRDLIRQKSNSGQGSVALVDEKGEVFPNIHGRPCFPSGKRTDILTGCGKAYGIEILLRNMTPDTIAVDEITAAEDCQALLHAGWCGVNLLATAHAGCLEDLMSRPVYRPIIESKIFDHILILNPDKSWRTERMEL